MIIAEKKKTFIMSREWVFMINNMTNEQAGELLKAIYDFQTSGNEPDIKDMRASIAFDLMRSTFEENEAKWIEQSEQNRENGAKGGRPKKANASDRERAQANANENKGQLADLPKKAVYGNVSVNGNVNDYDNESALLSAGEPSQDELTEEERIISLIVNSINRLSDQRFPMLRKDQISNFWSIYKANMDDPYDEQEIREKLNKAWINVNNDIRLMSKFKPFEIFRESLWER